MKGHRKATERNCRKRPCASVAILQRKGLTSCSPNYLFASLSFGLTLWLTFCVISLAAETASPATPPSAAARISPAKEPQAKQRQIQRLLTESQNLFSQGKFDLAAQRCRQVFAFDDSNFPAAKLLRKIDLAENHVPLEPENPGEQLSRKLSRIIIPKLELTNVTIQEAFDALRSESVQCDTDSPLNEKGVNFVLNLGSQMADSDSPVETPEPEAIPRIEGLAAGPPRKPEKAGITLTLLNIPLIEAIRRITEEAGTGFVIDRYAVAIGPQNYYYEWIHTREYLLDPTSAETRKMEEATPIEWLNSHNSHGAFLSAQASADYLSESHRLFVRNTIETLDQVDAILKGSDFAVSMIPPPCTAESAIDHKLDRIIIPRFALKDAKIGEALRQLSEASKRADPSSHGKRGVDFQLKLPHYPDDWPASDRDGPLITISLTNISAKKALRYVTELAHCRFKLTTGEIVVLRWSLGELATGEWHIRHMPFPIQKTSQWEKPWLISKGVDFSDPKSTARYLPGKHTLIVHNNPAEVNRAGEIIEAQMAAPKNPPSWNYLLEKKLERLIIPKVEFQEADVWEALAFLRVQFKSLDATSTASKRGVKFQVDVNPADVNSGGAAISDVRITVSLTNIPVLEALRYVVNFAGLKFVLTAKGIHITMPSPPSPTLEPGTPAKADGLVTKEWKLPADFSAGADYISSDAARNWLIANGAKFEGNAPAVYYVPDAAKRSPHGSTGASPNPQFPARLIVRNTDEQLDYVDDVLERHGLSDPERHKH